MVRIVKASKLPMTLEDMGLTTFVESQWREVARIACAPGDTMNNMPMELTVDDVYNAMVTANTIAHRMKG